ncbi:MAG: hypothetical protein IJ410_04760 [Oscillospiraceae bacterium]|nr:hypothetical protein [Oscillospiraceae bacterium]
MPQISTHLNLALKLMDKTVITDSDSFLLGCAYPDQWNDSFENSLALHYKSSPSADCNLDKFLEHNRINDDFDLGYYFHLWVDNEILKYDVGNISKSDCLICDMEVILFTVQRLLQNEYSGKKLQAVNNILTLKSTPLPAYIVDEEKRSCYNNILEQLATGFMKEIKQ